MNNPASPTLPAGLLAGIGLTRLRVYEQRAAPDGQMCGCAHVHALSDEAYYVESGTGAIELHDLAQGFRRIELQRGDYVQFGPGTLHRSVSTGGLEVLALMSNAGLAERGDARIYFGPAVDDDATEFARLKALPHVLGLEGALQRRDASILAYAALMHLWDTDRGAYFTELERFVRLHEANMAAHAADHARIVEAGPGAWLAATRARLAATGRDAGSGGAATVRHDDGRITLGMCGELRQLEQPVPV